MASLKSQTRQCVADSVENTDIKENTDNTENKEIFRKILIINFYTEIFDVD